MQYECAKYSQHKPILDTASQSAKIQWLNRQLDAAKIEIESNCVFDDHCQHSTIKHKGIFDADDPYDKPEDYDRNPIYSRDFRDGEGNVNVMIYGPVEREDEQIRKDDKDAGTFLIRKASSSPPNTDATYKTAYASGANPVLPANATQEYTMDFIDDNGRHQKLRIIKHNEKYQFIESKEKNFSEIWQLVMVVMVIGIEIKDKKSSSGWKRLDVKPLRNKLLPP
ncbi:hypothetical protein MAR_016433 [Mya arenaria]|uniref:Uncharacterized protein n=1 Tax=Mya arenaria TaxID=6604 RepID=A0ABY7FNL6_MYAAR|nr:hypothetical protein MAR_016433 [Mya arenaria]